MHSYLVYDHLNGLDDQQLRQLAAEFNCPRFDQRHRLIHALMHPEIKQRGAAYEDDCINNQTTDEFTEEQIGYLDPIMLEPIAKDDLIVVDSACFSRTHLKQWVETLQSTGQIPYNPINRQPLSRQVLNRLMRSTQQTPDLGTVRKRRRREDEDEDFNPDRVRRALMF